MKQPVLTLKFCQHYYNSDKKMLEQVWTNNSESMTTENFKSVMLAYVDLYKQYDVQQVLVDSREMRYLVEPEVQDWVNANIIAVILPYLRKLAFLLSSDVFEEVSIKQAMEEQQEDLPFETKYFGDEQQARDWFS
ncbi:MAG TPA: hypothetical protein DCS93_07810 [Microscillaceae bacterium]|nr:hypothetical protein [Microscillaceae bacterium]